MGYPARTRKRSTVDPFDSGFLSQNGLGAGRVGDLTASLTLGQVISSIRRWCPGFRGQCNMELEFPIKRIAIVCGSGGSLVDAARSHRVDLLLTGEATYHQMLEARSMGLAVLNIGHYASERFAMDGLAERLSVAFPTLRVWSSRAECDPVLAVE